jgi:hypothetical protein
MTNTNTAKVDNTTATVLELHTPAPCSNDLAKMLAPHGIHLTNLATASDKHVITEKNLVPSILPLVLKAWRVTQDKNNPTLKKLITGLFKVGLAEIVDKDTLKTCRDSAKARINSDGMMFTKAQDMARLVMESLEF